MSRLRTALPLLALAVAATAATAVVRPVPDSGLDLAGLDRSVRPQDDLFRFVNGGWLAATAIPPDQVSYGTFIEIADRTEADLHALIEAAAADPSRRPGTPTQQIGDLYASLMDEARLDGLGARPIRATLDRIDGLATTSELAAEAGRLSASAGGGPFDGSVGVDPEDQTKLVVVVTQGGTLLPDRDYYLKPDARFTAIRTQYVSYLTTVFTLTGRQQPAADAEAVLALETELAAAQSTQVESAAATTSDRYALDRLPREMPGFDWIEWAKPQGIDRTPTLILVQPAFFRRFAALVPATPLATWKAWLAARHITALAPFLGRALDTARFDFFGRVLSGQSAPRERWRRGVSLVSGYLGDAVGRLYVEQHFPAASMARVERLVSNVLAAYREAIAASEWMSPAAKKAALHKLSTIWLKIGHPVRWRNYRGLVIDPADLVGNVQRAQKFDSDWRMNQFLRPPDRSQWPVPPQTVNAFYNRALNEIVLPAAILQPPLFNVAADDAVNYGSVGAIVGHEIGHGLDEGGRYVDGAGAVGDWWSPDDLARFRTRARALVDQFNAYSPVDGARVNGELTIVENIGDLGGLSIAYRAYRLSLAGQRSPVIDGFTGEQRFFMGWARTWRSRMRDEYLRQTLLSAPHAPPELRVNAIVGHLDGFHEAFRVGRGDKLYRRPADRVRIW
jgi:predicted metalloendopeptidase